MQKVRDEIVRNLNESGQLERLCRAVSPHWADLMQEVNIILLTDPDAGRLFEMHERGELMNWVRRIIRNQAKSATGDFYRQYTGRNMKRVEVDETTIQMLAC